MKRISLKNVLPKVFSEDKDILSDVWCKNINFDQGNSYLIEAISGKGKSSLCSFIYGYRGDYSGDIYFNATDIRSFSPNIWDMIRTKELSLLFQELNLFPELTAMENILLKNSLTHYKEIGQVDDMFDRLGISNKKHHKIEKMSWGQQQRVAIIRALCQPFDFIILDEPISHLDDKNAATIASLVEEEAKHQGAGIIVTSIGKHLPLDYSKRISL